MLQDLIHVCDGCLRFSSPRPVQDNLLSTYNAVCRLLKSNTEDAIIGCITWDGWSAALGAPVLGITWHYVKSLPSEEHADRHSQHLFREQERGPDERYSGGRHAAQSSGWVRKDQGSHSNDRQ